MKTIDELKKYSGRTDESKNVTGDITIINVKNNPVAFAQQVVDIVDGKSKDQSTINTELQASIDSVKELIPDTQELTTTVKSAIVDSAPETLDTLNELAAALGDDENFAATVAEELGKKVNKEDLPTVDSKLSSESENAVLNKIITNELYNKVDKKDLEYEEIETSYPYIRHPGKIETTTEEIDGVTYIIESYGPSYIDGFSHFTKYTIDEDGNKDEYIGEYLTFNSDNCIDFSPDIKVKISGKWSTYKTIILNFIVVPKHYIETTIDDSTMEEFYSNRYHISFPSYGNYVKLDKIRILNTYVEISDLPDNLVIIGVELYYTLNTGVELESEPILTIKTSNLNEQIVNLDGRYALLSDISDLATISYVDSELKEISDEIDGIIKEHGTIPFVKIPTVGSYNPFDGSDGRCTTLIEKGDFIYIEYDPETLYNACIREGAIGEYEGPYVGISFAFLAHKDKKFIQYHRYNLYGNCHIIPCDNFVGTEVNVGSPLCVWNSSISKNEYTYDGNSSYDSNWVLPDSVSDAISFYRISHIQSEVFGNNEYVDTNKVDKEDMKYEEMIAEYPYLEEDTETEEVIDGVTYTILSTILGYIGGCARVYKYNQVEKTESYSYVLHKDKCIPYNENLQFKLNLFGDNFYIDAVILKIIHRSFLESGECSATDVYQLINNSDTSNSYKSIKDFEFLLGTGIDNSDLSEYFIIECFFIINYTDDTKPESRPSLLVKLGNLGEQIENLDGRYALKSDIPNIEYLDPSDVNLYITNVLWNS